MSTVSPPTARSTSTTSREDQAIDSISLHVWTGMGTRARTTLAGTRSTLDVLAHTRYRTRKGVSSNTVSYYCTVGT